MLNTTKSEQLYQKALQYYPGGVNSPVRAFKSVHGTPLFIAKGNGSKIYDADQNEYLDYCCSWGPLILGHNHPEVQKSIIDAVQNGTSFGTPTLYDNPIAELILQNNPFIQKIRFVSSGTEAVMSAIRLARGYTGKNKIIKFEGCYHGHADSLLVNAGSGLATFGTSSSAGVPQSFVKETIVIPLNHPKALQKAFQKYKNDIAAVIIEPIPANNGLLLQTQQFLQLLRNTCTQNNALLIFDEVISGFRVGFTGAAGYYNIQPDIITYGKIIGGGMPVGMYGASQEIMSHIAPEGNVYQAGTLSGNPVALAAGIAQLNTCLQPNFYTDLEQKTQFFVQYIQKHAQKNKYPLKVFSIASIFWLAFTTKKQINSAQQIDPQSMLYYKELHQFLLQKGIYFAPSGYEVGFISAAHTHTELEHTANLVCQALDFVFEQNPPQKTLTKRLFSFLGVKKEK